MAPLSGTDNINIKIVNFIISLNILLYLFFSSFVVNVLFNFFYVYLYVNFSWSIVILMSHKHIFTNFIQQHLKPVYAILKRVNELVAQFSNYDLLNESFIFHFYRWLDVEIRSCIDNGVSTIGVYLLLRNHDDTIYLLNDMVGCEYWYWDPFI